ncbi:FMN-binding protein [Muricauda sp. MAR_2010_75]|uniref:FMN-binding protein n=1 Tax=Allomuricauda sp. MAR_2010_75 TaxID=1250232 RepID=UPI00056D0AF3|nr:FMN-binding protein [Muricauda sp. MAR_2010_75]
MKMKLILLAVAAILGSCKQKTEKPKSNQVNQEPTPTYSLPKEMKEIAQFADLSLTDSTDVDTVLNFKAIDSVGILAEISMEEALLLYKTTIESNKDVALPIFESKGTQNSLLIVSEKGFGGKIWGKVLVDRSTTEITKVEFGHKAESDEYGADGITLPSFEGQFIGTKINWTENTFGLDQSGKTLIKGNTTIDGISGATVTSQAVLRMMNEGLQKYSHYLN